MEDQQTDNLPKKIYVSGMPMMWWGWNGAYQQREGKKEWYLPEHSYWGILIRPVAIIEKDGEWVLISEDSLQEVIATGPTSDVPFGRWNHFSVYPHKTLTTLFY